MFLLSVCSRAQVLQVSELSNAITSRFENDFMDPSQAVWSESRDSNGLLFIASFVQDGYKKEVFYLKDRFFLSSTQVPSSFYPQKVRLSIDSLYPEFKISKMWIQRDIRRNYAYKVELFKRKGFRKQVDYVYFNMQGQRLAEWKKGEKIPKFKYEGEK